MDGQPQYITIDGKTFLVQKKGSKAPANVRPISFESEQSRAVLEAMERSNSLSPSLASAPPPTEDQSDVFELDPNDLPPSMRGTVLKRRGTPVVEPRPSPKDMDSRLRRYQRALEEEEKKEEEEEEQRVTSSSEEEEEEEEENSEEKKTDKQIVWAAPERSRDGEGAAALPVRDMAQEMSVSTQSKKKKDKNIEVIYDFAEGFGTYTEHVQTWVNDLQEAMKGGGTVRIFLSPSVFPRSFFPLIGFSIGIYRLINQDCSVSVPSSAFDHTRLYDGIYLLQIPERPEFHAFYDAMTGTDILPISVVKAVRDEVGQFRMCESFLGIYRLRDESTHWRAEYYIAVRDVDRDASEELFKEIEAMDGEPFVHVMSKSSLEVTRKKSIEKRRRTAAALYKALASADLPSEDDLLSLEHHTTFCGFHHIQYDDMWLYACGVAPVHEKTVHIMMSTCNAGLHILGGVDGAVWSANPANNRMMPCRTSPAAHGADPDLIPNVFDIPETFEHSAPRNSLWRTFEKEVGRTYEMSEKQLEPVAVAYSTYRGDALELSVFNDL